MINEQRSAEARARAETALVRLIHELRDEDPFLIVLGGLVPYVLTGERTAAHRVCCLRTTSFLRFAFSGSTVAPCATTRSAATSSSGCVAIVDDDRCTDRFERVARKRRDCLRTTFTHRLRCRRVVSLAGFDAHEFRNPDRHADLLSGCSFLLTGDLDKVVDPEPVDYPVPKHIH